VVKRSGGQLPSESQLSTAVWGGEQKIGRLMKTRWANYKYQNQLESPIKEILEVGLYGPDYPSLIGRWVASELQTTFHKNTI
jgi:hypothetical protein